MRWATALLATAVATIAAGCAHGPQPHPLAVEINAYRASHGLPPIDWSPALAEVAQRHLGDIETGAGVHARGQCSLHSWSDRGPWRPCCYRDNDPASSRCMRAKPAQITGGRYSGPGYEILAYQSRDMDAQTALTLWRQSPRHHEVILNRGPWSDHHWRALGGALSDRHAILWFGAQPDPDH